MKNAGILAGVAVLSAAVFVAGCTGMGPRRPLPGVTPAPTPQGIEGNWIDQAGTGITRFFGGRFETVATDSGQKLSEGTYQHRDQVLVEISGISIIRQSPVAFNCAIAATDQLNCTAASGQQFVLTRYNGPMPQPAPTTGQPTAQTPAPAPRG
jgi:hypothetical protein